MPVFVLWILIFSNMHCVAHTVSHIKPVLKHVSVLFGKTLVRTKKAFNLWNRISRTKNNKLIDITDHHLLSMKVTFRYPAGMEGLPVQNSTVTGTYTPLGGGRSIPPLATMCLIGCQQGASQSIDRSIDSNLVEAPNGADQTRPCTRSYLIVLTTRSFIVIVASG
jgi:hypothetical protein